MKLLISPAALKGIAKMPKHDAEAMRRKLIAFSELPYANHTWAKRLVGSTSIRVRQGDWRAICEIDGDALVVTVEKVGNRREVYR